MRGRAGNENERDIKPRLPSQAVLLGNILLHTGQGERMAVQSSWTFGYP